MRMFRFWWRWWNCLNFVCILSASNRLPAIRQNGVTKECTIRFSRGVGRFKWKSRYDKKEKNHPHFKPWKVKNEEIKFTHKIIIIIIINMLLYSTQCPEASRRFTMKTIRNINSPLTQLPTTPEYLMMHSLYIWDTCSCSADYTGYLRPWSFHTSHWS